MGVLGLTFVGSAGERSGAMSDFLRSAFGLDGVPGPVGEVFALPDGSTILVAPGDPGERHRSVGLLVDDLDGALAAAAAAGAEVGPVRTAGEQRYAHFVPPDGHVYELIEQRSRTPL